MEFEEVVSYTLRFGVLASVVLIVTGLVIIAVKPPEPGLLERLANPRSPINTSLVSPGDVLAGSARLNGLDIVLLGLIVLIATPVVRVVVGLAQFIHERNYIYIVITAFVLFNLLFSILLIPLLYK